MRMWLLPMEGVGWDVKMTTNVRPFIVHPPKLLSILLHESRVAAHELASLDVEWLHDRATVRGKWRATHFNLVMEDVCEERRCPAGTHWEGKGGGEQGGGGGGGGAGGGGECVLAPSELAHPRIECLFLCVEALGPGSAGLRGDDRDGREIENRRVASLPLVVNGSCFLQGACARACTRAWTGRSWATHALLSSLCFCRLASAVWPALTVILTLLL